jgi:hypothetical protein
MSAFSQVSRPHQHMCVPGMRASTGVAPEKLRSGRWSTDILPSAPVHATSSTRAHEQRT